MEVLDDFIQILFDIIDKLFWFNGSIYDNNWPHSIYFS